MAKSQELPAPGPKIKSPLPVTLGDFGSILYSKSSIMRPNITLVLFLSMALVSSATIGKSQNTRSVVAAQQPQYDTIIIGRINTTVMTSRETREMEQAERDDVQEQRNRDQAAEDRAMLN